MKVLQPESPSDTMMACLCLFAYGKEGQRVRMALRLRLLEYFDQLLKEDRIGHPAMRALVKRLHLIYPQEIGPTPDFVAGDRLGREVAHFIALNRREGYIGDRFVFAYLFGEIFGVNVEINGNLLICKEFCDYTLALVWSEEERRFSLLVPIVAHISTPISRIHQKPEHIYSRALYKVRDGPYFVPPQIRGYKMHRCELRVAEKILCSVSLLPDAKRLEGERHYIFNEEDEELLSCIKGASEEKAYFYSQSTIYIVPAFSLEQARSIFSHEIRNLSTCP